MTEKKVWGRPFKKGAEWTGNAKGRPPGSPEIRALREKATAEERTEAELIVRDIDFCRRTARHDFAECLHSMRGWALKDLTEFAKRTDVRVIELIAARLLIRTMSQGKPSDVEVTHKLLCGQEPKQMEISGPGGEPLHPLSKVPPEDLIAAYQEVQRQIKEREACPSTSKPLSEHSVESPPLLSPPVSRTGS